MTEHATGRASRRSRRASLELELEGLELEGRADEAETKRDEYLDDLQRLAADFDNFRKRAAREQEARLRAGSRAARQGAPARARRPRARARRRGASTRRRSSRTASSSSSDELREVLEREGLVEIATDGDVRPARARGAPHPAVRGRRRGRSSRCSRRATSSGDRVLRPARVVLSAGPPRPPPRAAT